MAIGVGIADQPISGPIILASTLGLVLAGALWWLYFDTAALLAEKGFTEYEPGRRVAMARDG